MLMNLSIDDGDESRTWENEYLADSQVIIHSNQTKVHMET